MYRYDLIENSPRDKITNVEKQLPAVKWETAWVVADTVGGDKAAILEAWEREARGEATGLHPQDFFPDDDKVHKNEPLIRWVAEKISGEAREVRKGRKTPTELRDFYVRLEAALPQIAYWVEKTQPDLFRMSALQAIGLASEMEVEDDFPVPQGEVIYRFPDGWTVQELKTPEQVYAEGEVMQHCMRESASGPKFCKEIKRGETRLFSLRNPQGRPGVSMEYDPDSKSFVQIYAKQNVSLGSSLQELRDEEVANEDGTRRKRHKDPEGLWRGIQKYKPYIRQFIIDKFDAVASGLVMADVPLPAGLTNVEGWLALGRYNHPLPAGLTRVGGDLYLGGYKYPLPAGLKDLGGHLYVNHYKHPLPETLASVAGSLELDEYDHPLPAGLTSVGGLYLGGYDHPLPAGLTSVRGDLQLRFYEFPLPTGLTSVGDTLDLREYDHPLPAGLTSVGGGLNLSRYNHPLPAGFTSVGNDLFLADYNYPLPAGLRVKGRIFGAKKYPYEIPRHLRALKPNRARASRRKTSRSKRKTSRP